MNLRLRFVAWLLLIVVSTPSLSLGHDTTRRRDTDHNDTTTNYESVAVDVLIARPCWFVATVSRLAAKQLSGGDDLGCGRGDVAA